MAFAGAHVLSFESRRSAEIAQLIRIAGGEPHIAPALIEVPLEQNETAFVFGERLFAGDFDMMILLTGVGTRLLAKTLATRYAAEQFPAALRKLTTVARGPKPSAVLREMDVQVNVFVPEPNTWREVLAAIEGRKEHRVAVQEYGRRSHELLDGLKASGREVTAVPVYQWELPPDASALRSATRELAAGGFDAVLFTTSVQLDHLLQVSEEANQKEAVLDRLRKIFVASIGPTCTEALREQGLEPTMEPSHPKMGLLVQESGEQYSAWVAK